MAGFSCSKRSLGQPGANNGAPSILPHMALIQPYRLTWLSSLLFQVCGSAGVHLARWCLACQASVKASRAAWQGQGISLVSPATALDHTNVRNTKLARVVGVSSFVYRYIQCGNQAVNCILNHIFHFLLEPCVCFCNQCTLWIILTSETLR